MSMNEYKAGEVTYRIGDIVVLKSGSPKMTIDYIGDGAYGGEIKVQAKWFDQKTGDFKHEMFHFDEIKHVDKDEAESP